MTVWGAWEYSGGNGIRVGLDITWESVAHTEAGATATIEIWTENQYSMNDTQTLTYGGYLDNNDEDRTSKTFTNSQGGAQTLRDTVHYTYTYASDEYGSSPASRTFSASLSGAYNGVTPSVSLSSAVPARPYAAPIAPSSQAVSRINDASTKVSWTNNETAGKPWDNVTVQRSTNGGAYSTRSSTISGSATSYTDATAANNKYRYQVKATNSIGSSSYVATGDIWTTPAVPVITAALTDVSSPTGKRITWANTGIGYSEYSTEVYGYKNGVSQGLIGTVASGGTTFDHTTANGVAAYTTTDKWKYAVRHKTSSGTALYSAFSSFTNETPGTTSPPAAPTNLSPASGSVLDPNVSGGTTFQWTYNATDGSNQSKFDLQHRLVGASTWTQVYNQSQVVANGALGSYNLATVPYVDGNTVEWQVRTYGANASPGPWSASPTFTYTATVITPDPVKLPVVQDLYTGNLEASTTANELRDYIMRTQAKMNGGGVKLIDSSYNIKWGARFIPISMGRSQNLFPQGYHQIICPTSYTVTNKALTSNVATLTTSASHKLRPGESVTVSGVDATFNGTYTVREVTATTILYDKVASNVASTASGGTVGPTIRGHGDVADAVPTTTGYIPMASSWVALYYELVPGWGGKVNGVLTPKKNGVVAVTNKALTSNVATIHVQKPHYFAVGDTVRVDIGDPVFDGTHTITGFTNGVSTTSFTYAKTNANVASTPASGTARPTGIETFNGNFHLVLNHVTSVSADADFIVPSHWIKIAMRNADGNDSIEWCTGESDTGWQTPSLSNSWVDYGGAFATAQFRKVNGIVYLKGLVKNGTAGTSIFTLPSGFRPAATQLFSSPSQSATAVTGAASAGTAHTHNVALPTGAGQRIDVNADGTVVHSNSSIVSNAYVSLSGISFIAEA